jgi:hypothetical protein
MYSTVHLGTLLRKNVTKYVIPLQPGPTRPTDGRWTIEDSTRLSPSRSTTDPECRVHPRVVESPSTMLILTITTLTLLARIKALNES